MSTVKYWRIYCATSDTYEYVWSETTPTKCPTDTAHTIGAITEVNKFEVVGTVKVQEENIPTGGNFQCTTIKMVAAANSVGESSISWPYPITALSVTFASDADQKGDIINMYGAKNKIVGIITSTVSAQSAWVSQNYVLNDRVLYNNKVYKCILSTIANESPANPLHWVYEPVVINVSSTVTQYVNKGYYIDLFNGLTTEGLGRVIEIGSGTITVELAPSTTWTYNALAPIYVRMSVYLIKDFELSIPWQHVIGESKIGGSYVPANTLITATYQNTGNSGTRELVGSVEYLY